MKQPVLPRKTRSLAWILPVSILGLFALLYLRGLPSPPDPTDARPASGVEHAASSAPEELADVEHTNASDSVILPGVDDAETWQLVADRMHKNARAEATAGEILPADFLNRAVTGKTIAFTLPDGSEVRGDVEMIGHDDMGVLYVQAKITQPAEGFCFIQRQTSAGVAGPFVGHVHFTGSDSAWKIEPTADHQSARFIARDIDEVVCVNYTQVPAAAAGAEGDVEAIPQNHPTDIPIPPYQEIIPLQSLPGATGVLYLDFDGEKGPFPGWAGGDFDAAHSGASNAQIFDVWKMVCEDFQGFNLNVTTDRMVFDQAQPGRRQHIIITPTNTARPGAGGVAYVGTFNWSDSRVCWSFYTTGKNAAEVISHELGHTLNLNHHGTTTGSEYYYGHGSGSTAWAPIMGVGYSRNLTQWSKGEYANANRSSQDDLSIIANNNNNVGYRIDDFGPTLETARHLDIFAGGGVNNEGILETTGDIDAFRFRTSGGQAAISVKTVDLNPNLDLYAEIVRASDLSLVASDNPDLAINASLSTTLPAGEYLLRVRGTGRGDPLLDGYTNYGCIGSYVITGTVTGGVHADHVVIAENTAAGTPIATVAPRNNHGAAVLVWSITSGNTGGAFAINPANGQISVSNSMALDYEALSSRWDDPAEFELFVAITSESNPALNETIRVVVGVSDLNEPPSMVDGEIVLSESVSAGTVVGRVDAADSDRFDYLTYSIISGDPGGIFAMDAYTGEILTTTAINIQQDKVYPLLVKVQDQAEPPNVITATYTMRITNVIGQEAEIIIACDNGYELYVNGALKGSGSDWQQGGRFTVPMVEGRNVVAVKGTDSGGIAGLLAQITTGGIRSGTGSSWKTALSAPATWMQTDFNDSTWTAATDYGAYGMSPWNFGVSNMPSDTPARWIWSSDNDAHNQVYFRYAINVEAQPDNNPPVIAQGDVANVSMSKDATPIPFRLTLDATDANGDTLTWSVISPASHGTAQAGGTGPSQTIGYTPTPGYAGDDNFVVQVADGNGGVDIITVSVSIQDRVPGLLAEFFDFTTSLSMLPDVSGRTPDLVRRDARIEYPSTSGTWSGLPATMEETFASRHTGFIQIPTAGAYTFYLESDDGSKLWINDQLLINNDGLHGMVEVSGNITLTAGLHLIRVGFFENSGGAGLILRWAGPGIAKQVVPAGVLFSPGEGNRKPVAIARNITAPQGSATSITLTGSDADGDPLGFSIVSPPAHGSLGGTPPNVTYTPSVGYTGSDSFIFKVNDGSVDSDPATVSITVTPNNPPVALAQSVPVAFETAWPITLTGSDPDGQALTYAIVSQPVRGTLAGTPPAVIYTPPAGYTGNDSFTFKVSDGLVESAPALVSISILSPDTIVPVYSTRGDGKTVATFTSGSGTWTIPDGVTSVEVLVVGGGGAGASGGAFGAPSGGSPGGGAGGLYYTTTWAVTPGAPVDVAVGAGAPTTTATGSGANGGNSVFGSIIAYGGQGGQAATNQGGNQGGHSINGGTNVTSGFLGGTGNGATGGAGAGQNGRNGGYSPAYGGAGVVVPIVGTGPLLGADGNPITGFYGTMIGYAGGGSAGYDGKEMGVQYGESYGGGSGSEPEGVAGTPGFNTLGGGGGGGRSANGGGGGSGVVIIAYQAPPTDPYDSWAGPDGYNLTGDRNADDDGDGLSNFQEFAFGLNPTSGSSVNPITDTSTLQSAGTFSYTRLAGSGLTYTVWISSDLQDWGTEPVAAAQQAGAAVNGVETVLVTLPNIPTETKFFIRVKADGSTTGADY